MRSPVIVIGGLTLISERFGSDASQKLLNQSRGGRVSFGAPTFVGNKLGEYFLNTGGWSDVSSEAKLPC